MAQMEAEADDLDPMPVHKVSGSTEEYHTIELSQNDLHWLTEVAILVIEDRGSVRQIMHEAESGETERMTHLFDMAKADFDAREAIEDRGKRREAKLGRRVRIQDRNARHLLIWVANRYEQGGDLAREGMLDLAKTLAEGIGVRWDPKPEGGLPPRETNW